MRKNDPDTDRNIEKAISFLVSSINKTGHNPKPVILHSIRVALCLYEKAYSNDIVVAGVLHDLLEDSAITYDGIEKEFGKKVAKLVHANSFDKDKPDKTIQDKKNRYQEALERGLRIGKDALVIKAADILDNSNYYHLAPNKKLQKWLLEKMNHFTKHSSPFIKDESIWKDLNEQYKKILRKIES